MWNYYNPVQVVQGRGALSHIKALTQNQPCLLITFPEAAMLGLEAQVAKVLGDQLVGIERDIQPNPDVSWLGEMYERIWRDHAKVPYLIAVGGGSVIDTAKALLCHTPDGRFASLLTALTEGDALAMGEHKRLIAVPTTAGTGSEVTPWATIWDQLGQQKYSLHQHCTWPAAAVIDPDLTLSLPASVTRATALDALSHALESIWNVNGNPVSRQFAVIAAQDIIATLPALLADLANPNLRERMAQAAAFAGLAFSNTKTALAHSLSYPITLEQGVPHGLACSFSLPRILRMAFGHQHCVDRALLQIFQVSEPEAACASLERFLHGVKVSTASEDYGIPADEWQQRIVAALNGPRGRNFISNDVRQA